MANGLCARCGQRLDGKHRSYCKACAAAYVREQRAARPLTQYARLKRQEWVENNPEEAYAARRKYRLARYGLTVDEFELIMEAQTRLCAVCSVVLREGRGSDCIAVDHDHKTGQVRGVLCQNCNAMIGYAKDDPDRLITAAAYLVTKERELSRGYAHRDQ